MFLRLPSWPYVGGKKPSRKASSSRLLVLPRQLCFYLFYALGFQVLENKRFCSSEVPFTMLLSWFVKSPKWIQFCSPNLRDTKWKFGTSSLRGCQVWGFTDEALHSLLCVLVSHHRHQRELPFALCELAFAVAELTGGKADFLQSIWNGSDFLLPLCMAINSTWMLGGCFRDWRIWMGLKSLQARTCHKNWRKRVIMELGAMGRTNGIKVIKGDVPLE